MKLNSIKYFGLCIGFLVMLGCASSKVKEDGAPSDGAARAVEESQVQADSEPEEPVDPDIIAPGYLFQLSQLEDERLNGKFRVDFEGKLHLPYGNTLKAKGLTVAELKEKIKEAYRPFFKASTPIEVSLQDTTYWIEVRGPVAKPGRFLVRTSSTLDEILAMAGGPTGGAGSIRYLRLTQGSKVRAISMDQYYDEGDASQKIAWHGGDILFFQQELDADNNMKDGVMLSKTIKLLGEVRKPGDVGFKKDVDFFYYLAKAGGPTASADMSKVLLIRGKDFERKKIKFSGEDTDQLPKIQEGDTLILYADHASGLSKFIQSSAGVMTVITSIAFLVVVL